ncbi:MAG: STAS domain-containing protein [Planctomycetales bacterium]
MPDDQDFSLNSPDDSVLDDTDPALADVPSGDSGVLSKQPIDPNLLKITPEGDRLIIAYGRKDIPDELCVAGYRDQLLQLIKEYPSCSTFAFDVANVKMLPSGMLGILATVKQRGKNVEILNPSSDVRDVLRITRLETLFTIRDQGT